jgi:hypothetical protein
MHRTVIAECTRPDGRVAARMRVVLTAAGRVVVCQWGDRLILDGGRGQPLRRFFRRVGRAVRTGRREPFRPGGPPVPVVVIRAAGPTEARHRTYGDGPRQRYAVLVVRGGAVRRVGEFDDQTAAYGALRAAEGRGRPVVLVRLDERLRRPVTILLASGVTADALERDSHFLAGVRRACSRARATYS